MDENNEATQAMLHLLRSDITDLRNDVAAIDTEPGAPIYVVVMLTASLVLAACLACYFYMHPPESPSCATNSMNIQAQAESVRAQAGLNLENQKRIEGLQMLVAKNCADHGNTPLFVNGNVDCKIAK